MEINARIRKILNKLKEKNILVAGDLMLDKYIFGMVNRISPEAPIQIVNVRKEKYIPGGAANVCNNLAALGCRPYMGGVIGKDEEGQVLLNCLKEKNINSNLLVFSDEEKMTTRKIRVVSQGQQLLRIDYENPKKLKGNTEKEIIKAIKKNFNLFDLIIVSDYAKGVITENIMNVLIQTSIENNKKIIIDPKPKNKKLYKNAYLITPNLKEASEMTGILYEDEESIEKMALYLEKEMNSHILITCGDKGMYLLEKNGTFHNLPAKAREVYDVTGAGDTVIATLSLCLASGFTIREAAYIANYAAGIVVGKAGTATTTVKEIIREVRLDGLKEEM